MEEVVEKYLSLEDEGNALDDQSNELWREQSKLQKQIKKVLMKEARHKKIPASISCRIGKYKVSMPVKLQTYSIKIKEVS